MSDSAWFRRWCMRVGASSKYFGLTQRRTSPVPFIQDGTCYWPTDSHLGVIPEQHPLVLQRVVVGGLVMHVRDIGNHDKAVRKPWWNTHYLLGEAFQMDVHPFPEAAVYLAQ